MQATTMVARALAAAPALSLDRLPVSADGLLGGLVPVAAEAVHASTSQARRSGAAAV